MSVIKGGLILEGFSLLCPILKQITSLNFHLVEIFTLTITFNLCTYLDWYTFYTTLNSDNRICTKVNQVFFQSVKLKSCSKWFSTFLWGWNQIENTFWNYLTFPYLETQYMMHRFKVVVEWENILQYLERPF